jgi:GxxExxY protein
MSDAERKPLPAEIDPLAKQIVDAAFRVHETLGPGLLESVYEACLCMELSHRRIPIERQVQIPIFHRGQQIEPGLRIDLIVDGRVIVELKAVEKLLPVHEAQVLTYLKLTDLRLGLLINFNSELIKHGIKRIAL